MRQPGHNKSATEQGVGQDNVVDWLTANGFEVTRENYIDVNWLGQPPDPWTQEAEEQLPKFLRKKVSD